MLSKVVTASLSGLDVEKVIVETDFSQGLPSLIMVGLPDMTVRESKERIRSAVINSGYVFPLRKITVNLSPADTRKNGSHFDLPMAVGIMLSMNIFEQEIIRDSAFLGELSLDGSLNPVEGCLAMVIGLKQYGVKTVYLPSANIREITNVDGIEFYAIEHFSQLIDHLSGLKNIKPNEIIQTDFHCNQGHTDLDYSEIVGQESIKRAMQVSASGWHDLLMIGPPGSGKTMLAKRMHTIMTDPSKSELMEIAKIHSIAGEIRWDNYKWMRPFRMPHHTITSASLMGGGRNPKPGELSLAHRGVLFLDELPEFDRKVLDMLRQPLEDGYINLSRVFGKNKYPCEFIMVAAMNPCPCGYYGDPFHQCTCGTSKRLKYAEKISGPLKDRIDLHLDVNPIDPGSAISKKKENPISSRDLKVGVDVASTVQDHRYKNENFRYNSQIPDRMISFYCKLNRNSSSLYETACSTYKLSLRAGAKVKKVARTIADIEESEIIKEDHIAEALNYNVGKMNSRYLN